MNFGPFNTLANPISDPYGQFGIQAAQFSVPNPYGGNPGYSNPNDPAAQAGAANQGTGSSGSGLSSIASTVSNAYGLLTGGAIWQRVGLVVVGIIMVLIGLYLTANSKGINISLAEASEGQAERHRSSATKERIKQAAKVGEHLAAVAE